MTDMPDLLPCPFCGKQPYNDEATAIKFGRGGHKIACSWCEATAASSGSFANAVAAWNCRADTAPLSWVAAKQAALACCPDAPAWVGDREGAYRSGYEAAKDDIATDIRALPGPTDAQLLAAALAVPQIKALVTACDENIGKWLSAALDDPGVCAAMKADINVWFAALAAIEEAKA